MTGIIVGVDGSDEARSALAWADREAQLHGWPITAVMAWGLLAQQHADADAGFDPDYDDADARKALGVFITRAVDDDRAPGIGRRALCDLPARAVLDAAADADLVVVGSRGRGGFTGLLLGSTSQQVLHHTPCPIAIVRPGLAPADGRERIVVGIDGSTNSIDGLRWAVDEAGVRGAELTVVHSWHLPYMEGYPYGAVGLDPAPFEEAAQRTMDASLAAVDLSTLSHPVVQVRHIGGATEALLAEAEDADLVVVGTRGHGGFTGLLLGSVSHQVSLHAACTVVIVPPPT